MWGPSDDRGGGAATAMGNRLLLATPATSLEQPETARKDSSRRPHREMGLYVGVWNPKDDCIA